MTSAVPCVALLAAFLLWGTGMTMAGMGVSKRRRARAHGTLGRRTRIADAKDAELVSIEAIVESPDDVETPISRERVACAVVQLDTLASNTIPVRRVRRRRDVGPAAITIADASGRADVVLGDGTEVLGTELFARRLDRPPVDGPIADRYVPWPDDSEELGDSAAAWEYTETGFRRGDRVSVQGCATVGGPSSPYRGGSVRLEDRPGQPLRITNHPTEALRGLDRAATRELILGLAMMACAAAAFAGVALLGS